MGIYRNNFAAVRELAFRDGPEIRWDQSAPIVDRHILVSEDASEAVIDDVRAKGSAVLQLLDGSADDLSSPMLMAYELDVDSAPISGFYMNRQRISTPSFDMLVISDHDQGEVKLFLQGEEVTYDLTLIEHGLVAAGVATVFSEKLINSHAREVLLAS